MRALINKVESLDDQMLFDVAKGLTQDFRAGADTALDAVLNEIERRLPAADFILFCDRI